MTYYYTIVYQVFCKINSQLNVRSQMFFEKKVKKDMSLGIDYLKKFPYDFDVSNFLIIKIVIMTNRNKMTYKKYLRNQICDLGCVLNQFKKNNEVVIERWTLRYGYTYSDILKEMDDLISLYNRKYGKRWGMLIRTDS